MRFPSKICYFRDSLRVLSCQYQVNTCFSPFSLSFSNFDISNRFDWWLFVGGSYFSCASFCFGVSGRFFLRVAPTSSFFTWTGNMCYSLLYVFLSTPGRSLLFDWCFIVGFCSLALVSAYSLAVSGAHCHWLLFPFFSVLPFDPRYPCNFIIGFRLL